MSKSNHNHEKAVNLARERAKELYENAAIRETIFAHADNATRLGMALVSKQAFEDLGPQMYRTVYLEDVWRMKAAIPMHEREQTYLSAIRCIDVTGQFPAIASAQSCDHILRVLPAARKVTWGNGAVHSIIDRSGSRIILDRIVEPHTRYRVALAEGAREDTADSLDDGDDHKHGPWVWVPLPLTPAKLSASAGYHAGTSHLIVTRYYDDDMHDESNESGASSWPFSNAKVTPFVSFAGQFESLEYIADPAEEWSVIDRIIDHLRSRHGLGVDGYRSIKIRPHKHDKEAGKTNELGEFMRALGYYNPNIESLSLDIDNNHEFSAFHGPVQCLMDPAWRSVTTIRHLSIALAFDCYRTSAPDSSRPECVQPFQRLTGSMVDPLDSEASLGEPLGLCNLHVQIYFDSEPLVLPRYSDVAKAMMSLGGPECDYRISPHPSLTDSHLLVAEVIAKGVTREIIALREAQPKGWWKREKNESRNLGHAVGSAGTD